MRLVLKQFQEEAVTKLLRHIRGAARDSGGKGQLSETDIATPARHYTSPHATA
jgi:hypothetical protein